MKYYQVRASGEPEIIGVTNGIYQVEIDKKEILNNQNYDAFESFFNYNNKGIWTEQEKIDFLNPSLIKGKMLKKAKVTDIMGYTPSYALLNYIYSESFIDVIKDFNIDYYKMFPFKIENVEMLYYLLFVNTIRIDELNFERSVVFTGRKILKNEVYHSLKSFEDFLELRKEFPLISYEKITISKKFKNRDIIAIQSAVDNFYSERIIETLYKKDLKGIDVRSVIELDFY